MPGRSLCLMGLMLFLCSALHAQELKKKEWSISLGTGHLSQQHLVFSPFVHQDISFLNLGLSYSRQANFYQQYRLTVANFSSMVAEPFLFREYDEVQTANPHSFTFVNLDYVLGKTLKRGQTSGFTVGGLLSAKIQANNYVYGRFSNFGYFSTFGLGVFGKYDYMPGARNKFSFTARVPLVSWLAQSPYLVNDDEYIENTYSHSGITTFFNFIADGEATSWNRLQYLDLEARYQYRLSDRWALGAAYAFEFIHSSEPRSFWSFRNGLMFSTSYQF